MQIRRNPGITAGVSLLFRVYRVWWHDIKSVTAPYGSRTYQKPNFAAVSRSVSADFLSSWSSWSDSGVLMREFTP